MVLLVNAVALTAICVAVKGVPEPQMSSGMSSGNLLVCILLRQENFINLLYEIFTSAPLSWPLSIRKRLAQVYHYGGCHSGAGFAAFVWYMFYTAIVTAKVVEKRARHLLVDIIASWVVILSLMVMMAAAHPGFRRKHHNGFEMCHRFAGWLGLVSFWVHVIFSSLVTAREFMRPFGLVLIRSPSFWCMCVSTACTTLSWLRLHRCTVYPEKLSERATRLHFKHVEVMPLYGIRMSDRPLLEWHAFATIPSVDSTGENARGFSVLVGNAGNWTGRQINAAHQRQMWIRGAPMHGLLYAARLFRRVVIVATGSGIGPCLSLLVAKATKHCIFWSARNPESTYGADIVQAVENADPSAVIWNTASRGYPDLAVEAQQLVHDFNAEAVFIISNIKTTQEVSSRLQRTGIPAYGAIFDS